MKTAGWMGLAVTAVMLLADAGLAAPARYDLAYIWDGNLESVLDYRDELADKFPDNISSRLSVVARGREYGIIYDADATAEAAQEEIGRQAALLRDTDIDAPRPIEDQGYHGLYNVSYGVGPNLDVFQQRYAELYSYLGAEVGKNLFIEERDAGSYMLVYRRRGDRASTVAVARLHGRLLRAKKISTSITPENNNDVVYGESSMLDSAGGAPAPGKAAVAAGKKKPAVSGTSAQPAVRQPLLPAPAKRTTPAARQSAAASSQLDRGFEKSIEAYIKILRCQGRLGKDERTGWMVYDLARDVCLADINGSRLFQAASMIKPFIALAFFHQVEQGKLTYSPESRRMMEAMIQRSCNAATNWIMRRAGGPARCQGILHREYGAIFKSTIINEYIPAGGRTYRNSATPGDYIRFLRALWNLELPRSREIRRLMSLPGRDRIYHGTSIPQGTMVYNKTGSTAHVCGDMGILAPRITGDERHPYAIVGIIERSSRPADYGRWMLTRGNVIRSVSTLVYEEMQKQHCRLKPRHAGRSKNPVSPAGGDPADTQGARHVHRSKSES